MSKIEPLVLKTPKGTTDFGPGDMAIREKIFGTITDVFKLHGAVTIDTPVMELREILKGKYGEDSKLIFDLEDQGGELSSLRYDLTVPFARYLAMNKILAIKRYHIGKVYRRDQPAMNKGRRREFYQCDFDIAGVYDTMVPDAEILYILVEILDKLNVGDYLVKINHRSILDGVFKVCGVENDLIRPVSSAIDKLDKLPWDMVRKEIILKGVNEVCADKIGEYMFKKGLKDLKEDNLDENAKKGLEEMDKLFEYLNIFGISNRVQFDLSLARGLDYYTGVIFEACLVNEPKIALDADEEDVAMGSIAAGGRYDNLVGLFSGLNKKNKPIHSVPCVGLSIGVERIFSLFNQNVKQSKTQVFVMSAGDGVLMERLKIVKKLWENGISAELLYKIKPRLQAQFNYCEKFEIPFSVIIGQNEIDSNMVRIKDMRFKTESDGELVSYEEMVPYLKNLLIKI